MENMNPYQAVVPVAQQPKKKKTGLILAIVIPAVVILVAVGIVAAIFIGRYNQYQKAMEYLDDGDIGEAIEIHKSLGDYKDLAEEICDTAESRCRKLLSKSDYAKVAKLYKTMAEYPEAIEEMNKKVGDHAAELIEEQNFEAVMDMLRAVKSNDSVRTVIVDEIDAAADEIWALNVYYAQSFYQWLKDEEIYLESMDDNFVELIAEYMDSQWYWDVASYYGQLSHNAKAMEAVCQLFVAEAEEAMENTDYWRVESMFDALRSYDVTMDALYEAVYSGACMMMEQEDYTYAELYFELLQDYLGDYKDCAAMLEELIFCQVVEDLEKYMQYGWYSDAQYLLNSYSGEQYDRLLEVYLAYCGDSSFIADLEAGLLARLAASDAGATEQELIDTEWSYLEKYWNLPFYDSRLQELAYEYLNALDRQEEAVRDYYDYNYYDNYEYTYYWLLAASDRYAALDLLHDEYGYGNSDPKLQQVLGTSEQVRQQATADYNIYSCLSYYLWSVGPYEENGAYYLDVYNYTEYTFSMTVYQEFCDYYENTMGENQTDYVDLTPGMWYQIQIHFPEEYLESGDHWYIDWVLTAVYLDGVQIY